MQEAELQKSPAVESDRLNVVSLLVNVCDHEYVIRKVAELIKEKKGGYICFCTVHMVMESYDNPEFAAKVNGADFVAADGMPIVWMQKMQGKKEAARVRANDLMIMLCAYAEKQGLKVGFYGGEENVLDAISERAKRDFPDLQIAYSYSPPFRPLTDEEDAEITAGINRTAADILFMGLGCPKQENWMAAHKDRLEAVMLGVGASFDFYAGNVKESPEWIGKLGLEWLFRLAQQPRRLWKRYLILNPRFVWAAVLQLTGLKRFDK